MVVEDKKNLFKEHTSKMTPFHSIERKSILIRRNNVYPLPTSLLSSSLEF
jgi:hypothetical protein